MAFAAALRVEGRVVDQSGLALPGVTVRLVAPTGEVQTAVTGANGEYSFDVEAGTYRLEAVLDGFQPSSREIVAEAPVVVPDVVLGLAAFTQETTVVGTTPTEIQPRQYGEPATLTDKVIDNAPLKTNRYDDVLPLLPNVVRGPDGLISVAGARAPQGLVLLNGVAGIDAANGEPAAPAPLAAVESVQVITTGFPAEYGRSTGGVTTVNTRAGGDQLRFTANSFTPRPRLGEGGVKGIEAWQPNMGIRGPLRRGRAWFAQSLDYRYERTEISTVAGDQDRRQRGLTSFTQVDARLNPSHVVTGWFSGQGERLDGAGLSAFNPLGTVPNLRRTTWGGALVDRATLGDTATLETRLDARHQDLSLRPVGTSPYVVRHAITTGSYFEALDRDGLTVQASSVYSKSWSSGFGSHVVKAGASVVNATLDGTSSARTATYLRSSGLPARRVDFVGAGRFDADAFDAGAFIQDTWTLSSRLVADVGVRFDRATHVGGAAAPRLGLTWKADDVTTVTGGVGLFTDKVPLAALAFPGYQSRAVTRFDGAGVPLASAVVQRNEVADRLDRPRAWIWSAQADRRLGTRWQLRGAYQERRGANELVVVPAAGSDGSELALVTSGGESRSRSFETTVGFRPERSAHQFYVSYVRSSSRGNANDFNQVEGTFRDPLLEASEDAPLPTDVPHRLLVWGLFSLPARVTIAPFLEVRSGFPYSPLNDDWSLAGRRFTRRYPAFASLDVIANKTVTLPGGVRSRIGVKLYNLAGRRNGRDVQRDVERADFGNTYNALGRQVRGVFEIIWGGPK